ncbi:hypothetical protein [Aquibacillus kalidii]|uniref:hypothetical protein n=1 Tax=Aquibacillus kalidii TaxID=2762597 RepID=UPI00164767BD|nr:hypothetical protein [Aquibacillus kalidii]
MTIDNFQLIAGVVFQFMVAVLIVLTALVIYKKFFNKQESPLIEYLLNIVVMGRKWNEELSKLQPLFCFGGSKVESGDRHLLMA